MGHGMGGAVQMRRTAHLTPHTCRLPLLGRSIRFILSLPFGETGDVGSVRNASRPVHQLPRRTTRWLEQVDKTRPSMVWRTPSRMEQGSLGTQSCLP